MAGEVHLGKNLKEITKTLELTQHELARLMGLTQSYISKLFQSETIDDNTLKKFSEVTEMPLKYIKNYHSKESKVINNLCEGSNNKNVGLIEIGQQIENQNITNNDLTAILDLGREKEILLIKSHITQLRHNILVAKMNNILQTEISEMEMQIKEKELEIEKIEQKII